MQQRVHLPSQPAAVADRVLVRQALAGDQDAFESLVRRYHVPVLATWDIRSNIRGERAMWKSFPIMSIKRKRYG